MIFDFDGSDNAFTLFTETETRECASPSVDQLYLRYRENMNGGPTYESQLGYHFHRGNTHTTGWFTISEGAI